MQQNTATSTGAVNQTTNTNTQQVYTNNSQKISRTGVAQQALTQSPTAPGKS
jgi:hypothetical protein